jgi:phage-related protein
MRAPHRKHGVGEGAGLYEVRTQVNTNTYRVLFCVKGSVRVLLHGFQKKAQKTPKRDLDLGRRRQREVEDER